MLQLVEEISDKVDIVVSENLKTIVTDSIIPTQVCILVVLVPYKYSLCWFGNSFVALLLPQKYTGKEIGSLKRCIISICVYTAV